MFLGSVSPLVPPQSEFCRQDKVYGWKMFVGVHVCHVWLDGRDEDEPEWMEWAAMGHALHVAPASVAEAVEGNWLLQRLTVGGGVEYSCGCMDYCDNYGAVCTSCACDTYTPRTFCARASYALRVLCVRVDLPTRTRRSDRSCVLGWQHVRVARAVRTRWRTSTYVLPK